jgi:osmotically inducible lipoprotein OsmB
MKCRQESTNQQPQSCGLGEIAGLPLVQYLRKGEDMKKILVLVVVATLMVSSCAGMSTTEQRVLSGGAIGASSGALIGWAAGNPAVGAAVGAGAGALGGYIYDRVDQGRNRDQ